MSATAAADAAAPQRGGCVVSRSALCTAAGHGRRASVPVRRCRQTAYRRRRAEGCAGRAVAGALRPPPPLPPPPRRAVSGPINALGHRLTRWLHRQPVSGPAATPWRAPLPVKPRLSGAQPTRRRSRRQVDGSLGVCMGGGIVLHAGGQPRAAPATPIRRVGLRRVGQPRRSTPKAVADRTLTPPVATVSAVLDCWTGRQHGVGSGNVARAGQRLDVSRGPPPPPNPDFAFLTSSPPPPFRVSR